MSGPAKPAPEGSFQRLIEDIYFDRDKERGTDKTLLWFCEEVGELVRAVRRGGKDRANLEEEFGDVYAWLSTLASLHGLDLEEIGRKKYGQGCPRCSAVPCDCPHP
ncbi:MAG: MazG nucleotide pyrophosphohydrolase domain-containing protein [Planctomycetota bacterium]